MRIALLSDVHGNLPAFGAVLGDVESIGVDEIWCLGDLVGYGAQPDGCVALARERCDVCLAGNHDLVVTGAIDIADFSATAAAAARWTRDHISEESLGFLKGLEPFDTTRELGLYHASPRDPVWEYVLSTWQAGECMNAMEARVGAIGHSHVALFFYRQEDRPVHGAPAPGGTELDISEGRLAAQPRRRRPAARRRPARRLAARGHRCLDRRLAAGRVPDRRGRAGDRGRRAPDASWPTASTTASEGAGHSGRLPRARRARGGLRRRRGGPADPAALRHGAREPSRPRSSRTISQGSLEACQEALDIDLEVQRIVDSLPDDVDQEVRDALRRSFDRLFELVGQECNELDQTETETTPTETETTPTETETMPTETVTTRRPRP